MKNKNFFYLQYNKINWENQNKTKINEFVNNYIIKNIILKNQKKSLKIFDIGFGIGFFIKMLSIKLNGKYQNIIIEGCEPSNKNYNNLINVKSKNNFHLKLHNDAFQDIHTNNKFDFITAIYVFPHFESDDLDRIAKKIRTMLEMGGKFILVVAEEKYLKEKLKSKKDLFIEENTITFKGKKYKEFLHYSEIPEIGKVIDYNREENFYIDLFKKNNFILEKKTNLNDQGFICTIFILKKQ